MNDFKSYSQSGGNQGGNRNGGNNRGGNTYNAQSAGGDVNSAVNMAEMMAKAFAGKSEGQILQTILAQAEQGKRDGTLTNADIDNFYNAVAPMLDGFKRQKLKNIVARLKSI